MTEVTSVQFHGQRGDWPADVVYVGMPGGASRAFGIPDTEGLFGKPWSSMHHPEGWPTGYLHYLVARLQNEPEFEAAVRALHGKRIACWCLAKDAQRCHAFILREFVQLLNGEQE